MLSDTLTALASAFGQAATSAEAIDGLVAMPPATFWRFQELLEAASADAAALERSMISPVAMAPADLPTNVVRLSDVIAAGREPDDNDLRIVGRIVQRDQVSVLGNTYFARELEPWHGERVLVGYDLRYPEKVWINTTEGKPICVAHRRAAT